MHCHHYYYCIPSRYRAQASWRIPKCCWYHLSNKTLELCCFETDNQNDSGLLPESSFQWNTGIILYICVQGSKLWKGVTFGIWIRGVEQFPKRGFKSRSTIQNNWFWYFIGMMILVKDKNCSDYQSQNSTIPMFYWKDDTNNI